MNEERIVSSELLDQEIDDLSLRPQTLSEYIGQKDLKANLEVFIQAAKLRDESLDH